MMDIVKFRTTVTDMRFINLRLVILTAIAIIAALSMACGGGPGGTSNLSGPVDPNETAATVNGRVIKMEDVERAVKQQAQGQDTTFSQLELTSARLQVLQSLIEQEVMFQKAEKEGTVPTDDEITAEVNKEKNQSGKSADQIEKEMKDQGMTEASLRDQIKKQLAIQKLTDKITGKIEQPKDSEIEAFYNGNKDAFVKKRGVRLAAIVFDPAASTESDAAGKEQAARLRASEIAKKLQTGQDFAQLARDNSEDQQSRLQGGDLGYISEDNLRQTFPQVAADLMNPQMPIGKMVLASAQGKFFILKLQER